MSISLGMNDITKEGRAAAWQLILGIDKDSEEYFTHVELYHMFVAEKCEPKSA